MKKSTKVQKQEPKKQQQEEEENRSEQIRSIIGKNRLKLLGEEIVSYLEEALNNFNPEDGDLYSIVSPFLTAYIEDEEEIKEICGKLESLFENEENSEEEEKRIKLKQQKRNQKQRKQEEKKSKAKKEKDKQEEENSEEEEKKQKKKDSQKKKFNKKKKSSSDEEEDEDEEEDSEEVVEVTSNQNSYARIATGRNRTVNLDGFSLCHGTNVLIVKAKLLLLKGHRYGIVGKNGCGKTTLMKKISKKQIQNFPPHLTTAIVEQEIKGSSKTVLETVLSYDSELENLKKEEKRLLDEMEEGEIELNDAQEQLEEIYAKMELKELHTAENRAKKILQGFGFTEEMMEQTTISLSGGWRMKVSLSGALFSNPDILCLDEPTNHLSISNRLWLQNYLTNIFKNTLVVVSHDSEFLNSVTTDIIEFRKQTLEYFPGNFDNFLETKSDRIKHRNEMYESQQRKISQAEASLDKIKQQVIKKRKNAKSKKAKKAEVKGVKGLKSKIEKAVFVRFEDGKHYRMTYDGPREMLKPEQEDRFKKFEFHSCLELNYRGPILQVENVSFTHEEQTIPLFEEVTIDIGAKDKIAIVGENGVGKTTLLDLIWGENKTPQSGKIHKHHSMKVAYFTQHHIQQLDLELTPIEHLHNLFPTLKEEQLRSHLANFGLVDYIPLQKMKTLSGGEKSRVVFATITMDQPHLLLLDEASNHLDSFTQDVLIEALKKFNGAIILVSHDQRLISSVTNKLWLIENRKIVKWKSTFEDFISKMKKEVNLL